MPDGLSRRRLLLGISVVLVVAVALVVTIGVVPPVRAGDVPNMTPERAVPAFWVAVGLHLLVALVLTLVLALSKRCSAVSTSVLVINTVVILLVAFALGDAAKASLEIGAPMQVVTALLLGCVAADAFAGALVVTSALTRSARA